jgi:Cofactor assembly of complex C subunit B
MYRKWVGGVQVRQAGDVQAWGRAADEALVCSVNVKFVVRAWYVLLARSVWPRLAWHCAGKEGAMALRQRAAQLYNYFKNYNYEVKDKTGEVITFVGTYAADKGQAAALVFYTFISTCMDQCLNQSTALEYWIPMQSMVVEYAWSSALALSHWHNMDVPCACG